MTDTRVSMLEQRLTVATAVNPLLPFLLRVPTAVLWNRLEGRPRSNDLTRPMRAEVRDPLWMLARQWQFGEFEGEDAGVPIDARVETEMQPVTTLKLRDRPSKPYDGSSPLETVVERHAVEPDLMMSLFIGRRWLTIVGKTVGVANPIVSSFRTGYAFAPPPVLGAARDLRALQLETHTSERQLRLAVAGRGLDGALLIADLAKALRAGQTPSDAFADRGVLIPAARRAAVDAAADDFRAERFAKLFSFEAPEEGAWVPEQLEHQFSVGTSTPEGDGTLLLAAQYAQGHLDWYSFDVARSNGGEDEPIQAAPDRRVISFLPTRAQFPGMPNVRWWEFEDRRVGFGLVTAAKTDLVKLLLAEFGLVFSNDWFILPLAAKVGTLVDTKRLVVSDNFGFNTLIESTASRHTERGLKGRWTMWTLTPRGEQGRDDLRLFLAPAIGRSHQSGPVDEVVFLRDEMANLVWAAEVTIPDPLGGGRDAHGAARLLGHAIAKAYYPEGPPEGDTADDILLTYQLMGSVPENWVPLVSVRLNGEETSTAVLQGAMPRVPPLYPVKDVNGSLILEHNVVLPRGSILSRDPVRNPNLINEEEILRGGAVVTRAFQQTRWHGGGTFTWIGRQTKNGRGEGSSGLAFDQVQVSPQKPVA